MSEPAVDKTSKAELPTDTTNLPLKESDEAVTTTSENQNGTAEPKKKRGAERQMTKDDYDRGEGEEQEIKHGFQRASAEVLAKRKIFKVKRPNATTSSSATQSGNASGGGAFGGFKFGGACVYCFVNGSYAEFFA